MSQWGAAKKAAEKQASKKQITDKNEIVKLAKRIYAKKRRGAATMAKPAPKKVVQPAKKSQKSKAKAAPKKKSKLRMPAYIILGVKAILYNFNGEALRSIKN